MSEGFFDAFIDLDTGAMSTGSRARELPDWLREIVWRAFAGQRHWRRQPTYDDFKNHLKVVPPGELHDDRCSICFEGFDEVPERTKAKANAPPYHETETQLHKLSNIPILQHEARFSDAALFFPQDPTALDPIQFPTRSIYTLEDEDDDPGLDSDDDTHVPVQLPCHHVFGRSCLKEWFNNGTNCPLCRQKVGDVNDDSPQARSDVRAQFQPLVADETRYIQWELTNVFRPFRRPANAAVTPLTDHYVNQLWATPVEQDPDAPLYHGAPDPSLVLPRRLRQPARANPWTRLYRVDIPRGQARPTQASPPVAEATIVVGPASINTATNTTRAGRSRSSTPIRSDRDVLPPTRPSSGGPERARRGDRSHPYRRMRE